MESSDMTVHNDCHITNDVFTTSLQDNTGKKENDHHRIYNFVFKH